MNLQITCSNCGHRSRSFKYDRYRRIEPADEIVKAGWNSFGSAFYCPKCVKSWEERNGKDRPLWGKAHTRERVAIMAHAIDGGNVMRRHRELAAASETGAGGEHDGGGSEKPFQWERRKDEPGADRVADGVRTDVHAHDTDAEGQRLHGRRAEEICGGGYYRYQLHELLELTPLGRIGLMNPEYLEYVMGFPIGWTELNALETQ